MAIAEVYEKYKHMDSLLSDSEWMRPNGDSDSDRLQRIMGGYTHEFWLAIKAEIKSAEASVSSPKVSEAWALAEFGRWVIEQMADPLTEMNEFCSSDSYIGDGLAKKAVELGCPGIERVSYDPAIHGDVEEAEPGKMIFWFGGAK